MGKRVMFLQVMTAVAAATLTLGIGTANAATSPAASVADAPASAADSANAPAVAGDPGLRVVDGKTLGGSYPCHWATHWQNGSCVAMLGTYVPQSGDEREFVAFTCPAGHQYPFEGAFSANPTWSDQSRGGLAVAVNPVAADGQEYEHDSFDGGYDSYGSGPADLGYIAVHAVVGVWDHGAVVGQYECSDKPANG